MLLKQQNRNLKTLLSIGGYTYSPSFSGATNTATKINTFASSAVTLVKDLGFDGIDIDWEYPANPTEAEQYVQLLQALRNQLNTYATGVGQDSTNFVLSAAVPAGPDNYQKMDIKGMDQYLDMWNLMAYDYSGSWDTIDGYQANVFPSTSNPAATPFNTKQAVDYYLANGATASKFTIGCPLYGRAFTNTTGPGQPFSGVGAGSWDDGVWDWKVLPLANTTVASDDTAVASWCTDSQNGQPGTVVSYDTIDVANAKANYVKSGPNGTLGGLMWWESSADRTGNDSMIQNQLNTLGGTSALQQKQNTIAYPQSQYDNLKNGFPPVPSS